MKIQIFQIKVNEGRRKIDPEAVHELANSISKVGLTNPITVDQDYTLIAGLHRLEAAKLLGWTEIECTVSDLDGLLAELAEIDENLVRRGLDYIDEGKQLERRKEIYETLHPETRRGKRNGQTSKNEPGSVLGVASFSRDTAQKAGISPRTIEQKIQVAKNLTPETAEIVKEHGIGFKKALKLSRLAPEHQKEAVTQLVTGDVRSTDEYRPTPAESEPADKQDPKQPLQPPEVPTPPALETGHCPTIRDLVADLKNPDKDRSPTPETFLMSFTLFLKKFCQSVNSYAVHEFSSVFPVLTREHLDQIQHEICFVHSTLDDFFNIIERKSKNEQM